MLSVKRVALNQMHLTAGHRNGGSCSTLDHIVPRNRGGEEGSFDIGEHTRVLCKQGQIKHALQMLHLMDQQGIPVQFQNYAFLLQGCINTKSLADGKQVHAHIIKSGFQPNIFLGNNLVNMYAKCGGMVDARKVFDEMLKRDVVSWTAMITGYVQHGNGEEAVKFFHKMQQEGVKPNEVTFVSLLKACACLEAVEQGKYAHAHIIKMGFEANIFVGNTLVDMYAKCGRIGCAREVFDKMPKRDVVSWNVMITGYNQHGQNEEALKFCQKMQQERVEADKVTFINALKACGSLVAKEQGEQVHAHIIKSGFELDVFVGSALIDMYAKCGSSKHARQVFEHMPRRDVVLWNAMIACYVQHGHGDEALKLFQQMQQENVKPTKVTIVGIVKACAVTVASLEEEKQIHAHIIKNRFESDAFVGSSLVDMYAKSGSIKHARQVFDKMPARDVVTWTAMIAGYAQHGCAVEALEIFWQMYQEGVMPNGITFTSILNVCVSLASLKLGKLMHAHIVEHGCESDVFVGNAIIEMYAKCGSMELASQVFNNMPKQNVVSWTVLLAGYTQNGDNEGTLKQFLKMQWGSVKPNEVTFITVLKACANLAALEQAKQIHSHIIKSGFDSDVLIGNALIDLYTKCGSVEYAWQVFNKMPKRDVISWNAMIFGYIYHGHGEEALHFFWLMYQEGLKPNRFTFSSLIKACTIQFALEQGKQIHALIVKSGLELDVLVAGSLVDMYAKCGSIGNACQVFDKMSERDVISWNSLIAGCAQHGHGKVALQLFEKMQRECVRPDHLTFIRVLSACNHVGLVDEGCQYFDSMNRDHGIAPAAAHYVCMADLLGRAGRLEQAYTFIKEMPFQPTSVVWMALLGACRIHDHVDLALHVVEWILELDPQNSSAFVLLSNMYAAAGRWDGKTKVRKMMNDRDVKKDPGCSWIEVSNQVHAFVADDMLHPHLKEIQAELKRLSKEMAELGYLPNTRFVLFDLEEQQKENFLCHHSEKLAIAFGLISTPAGTPIRIIKNLRVCGDCHTAAKFISKIVRREVFVRDINRFHHFKDGFCSCGDYW